MSRRSPPPSATRGLLTARNAGPSALRVVTRRRWLPLVVGFCVLALLGRSIYTRGKAVEETIRYGGGKLTEDPPGYESVWEFERTLPQHDLDLPFPEGRTGRYLRFENQIYGLGWNNVLNELLLSTHLAYLSNRAYVFQKYHWKQSYYHWRLPIPPGRDQPDFPTTPLNALISGPTAGGPWEEGDPHPRSISDTWFTTACPREEIRFIWTDDVKPALVNMTGDGVMAAWAKLLLDAPERCIEIRPGPSGNDGYPQTFDLWLIGSDRILGLWKDFFQSPTSRLLGTPPIVQAAIARNEYLFAPRGQRPPVNGVAKPDPYERMLAMHVRRGDFKEACTSLATWRSSFYCWNLIPSLPDKFDVPPSPGGSITPEIEEHYFHRCLPSLEKIITKVRDVRADYAVAKTNAKELDIMFILSNEKGEWIEQLKTRLRDDGWTTIVTSADLILDKEQLGVDMAIDMDLARKAAVFIGNGWSSFTSNIVHRRLVDHPNEPYSTRFW